MKQWSISQPGILPGDGEELRLQDAPQVGRVVDVTTRGVRVELDSQRGVLYGPARWDLGDYDTPALAIAAGQCPRPGDIALVVFAGIGIDDPWIVARWR